MTPKIVNRALLQAFDERRLSDRHVATELGVDPKTVQRWIAGRVPQPTLRWKLAQLLDRREADLWPESGRPLAVAPEILRTWPHRSDVPRNVWRELFAGASAEIGILAYSALFLVEDVQLVRLLRRRAEAGVSVRVLLGDPDAEQVRLRGAEEGIGDAMAAKVRNSLVLLRQLLDVPAFELRLHGCVLYNSLYVADADMLVNPHVYGCGASVAPVLHLRAADGGDLVGTYTASFDTVWDRASPVQQ